VSCPTTTDCWAAGWSLSRGPGRPIGVVAVSDDRGASWGSQAITGAVSLSEVAPQGDVEIESISSVSCFDASACFALGTQAVPLEPTEQQVVLRSET
jgi:hypothetical protein